jgi:hypothetical protein
MTDVVTPVLFLHIPKTAGTAVKIFFKQRLEGFVLQANDARQLADKDPLVVRVRDLEDIRRVLTDSGGLALHVDSNFEPIRRTTDFRSLAWHLFEPDNVAYFRQLSILTMFREPFRRFLSEYAFLRRTKAANPGFLPNLDVSSVEAYAGRVHANSVLHFLLEGDLSRHLGAIELLAGPQQRLHPNRPQSQRRAPSGRGVCLWRGKPDQH